MSRKLFLSLLLCIAALTAQTAHAQNGVSYRFGTQRLSSEYFPREKRVVKTFLPPDYSPDKKYPVIYVLDGDFLFEPTAAYVRELTKGAVLTKTDIEDGLTPFEIIPQSIVVGIYHNDRNYETEPNFKDTEYLEGSQKLKLFIENELIPHIDRKYPTSGYNVIIGHSNTGHFALNLLNQEKHSFDGIVALSVCMDENTNAELVEKLTRPTDETIFLGYGTKDDDFKEFAQSLPVDHNNDNLRVQGFNADHLELPATALFDGLKFMFRKYKNMDYFPAAVAAPDFSMADYAAAYTRTIERLYGIRAELSEVDCWHLATKCTEIKNAAAFYNVMGYIEQNRTQAIQNHTWFYMTRDLGDFDAAKKWAYKMAESNDSIEKRILVAMVKTYIDFFVDALKDPAEAVAFLERAAATSPEYKERYAAQIDKISSEHKMGQ